MNATALISVCAMIIGLVRRHRRNSVPKMTPMITFPMNGPKPWCR
jgi:hypothetical protein